MFFPFCFLFLCKLCDISCKENSGTPSCTSPGKLNREFVVAYAPVVSAVLTLKSCAVTAKIVKHKIQILYLGISFHSPFFPLSPNTFLVCVATLPLHSSFFRGCLREFCLFSTESSCFPRVLLNALHLLATYLCYDHALL